VAAYPLTPPTHSLAQAISLLYREPLFQKPNDTVQFHARTRFVKKRRAAHIGLKIHHDPFNQLLLGSPTLQKISGLKNLIYINPNGLPLRLKIENDKVSNNLSRTKCGKYSSKSCALHSAQLFPSRKLAPKNCNKPAGTNGMMQVINARSSANART
jgi:hypothetical protein